MKQIKINEDILPLIFNKASREGKSIEVVVNEILESTLVKKGTSIVYKCVNCDCEIKEIVNHNSGNCRNCGLVLMYSNQ